jgi:hypothetical protein
MSLRLCDVTFCQKCLHWVKVTAVGLCTCGAVLAASPSAGAADQSLYIPGHHLKFTPLASDSEPNHPTEPNQTLDGPSALYSGTASTTQLMRHVVRLGGPASTIHIAGLRDVDL